jgi:hypothetical protein
MSAPTCAPGRVKEVIQKARFGWQYVQQTASAHADSRTSLRGQSSVTERPQTQPAFTAHLLLIVGEGRLEGVHHIGEAQQGAAATGDNALLHGGLGGVQRILHTQLLLLQLSLGLCTNLQNIVLGWGEQQRNNRW